jgi:hypothetical protein
MLDPGDVVGRDRVAAGARVQRGVIGDTASPPSALLRLQRQRRPTRSRLTSAHTDTRDEQHESHLHLNERDAAADLRPGAHHHRQRRADIRENQHRPSGASGSTNPPPIDDGNDSTPVSRFDPDLNWTVCAVATPLYNWHPTT